MVILTYQKFSVLLVSRANWQGLDANHFELGPYQWGVHRSSKNMIIVCLLFTDYTVWEEGCSLKQLTKIADI